MFSERAIVIGGGYSGLVTARVLADFFAEVVVLEKDAPQDSDQARKGVPQGHHVHGLQGHALDLLNHYYPGIETDLIRAGAVSLDFGERIRLYLSQGWVPPRPAGRHGLSMTRPLLESVIRTHTQRRSNIRLAWHQRVSGLNFEQGALSGVSHQTAAANRLDPGKPSGASAATSLSAALVIDASGRGTRTARWLAREGFSAPAISAIEVDVRYATALYERPPGPESEIGYVVRHYPMHKLGAALLPVEDNQWLLSLSGRFGVYPGKDADAFMASAAQLPIADIYETLQHAPATTGVSAYTFSRNEIRHYPADTPAGLVPVGDSVIALNPLYGQGMTSAVVQADLLSQSLREINGARFDPGQLSQRHLPKIAHFSAPPWKRAVLGDTLFKEAKGDIPADLSLWRAQEQQLNQLAAKNAEVARLIAQVAQFAEPPEKLEALLV